ncbi:trans-Golgi network-localized SYP41-interacting protein 1 isoform X2 [Populus alba]|uniref:trans-Golgi network-localized SYP41-interacting protein 1 isoform X2 n=1 Tax=Populus alba TaxID=43335 RepID=UPI001589AD51|nr:putative uncharacterized protein MYH16 isoform X2 [Populus alba]
MSESKEQNGVTAEEDEESNGVAAAHTNQEGGEMLHVESKEDMFEDATDDIEENQFQEIVDDATLLQEHGASSPSIDELKAILDKTLQEKQTLSTELKEERESISRDVSILCHELKGLADKQSLSADYGNQEEMVADNDTSLLREMLSECSQFVKVALDERLRTEGVIRELNQRIEDLTVKAQAEEGVEVVADRLLASLGVVVNPGELLDYSVMGKLAHVERSGSLLVDHYSWMLYEIDQLRACLTEGGFNFEGQEPFGPAMVFAAARGELVELKRKEVEMVEKLGHLEDESRKLVEQVEKEKMMAEAANVELGRMKVELEQEKNRFANTKDKLSMAVTKGKALVQQRDSLKHALAEKTSELDKCLAELQEKSSAIETAELCKGELVKCENLVASLQETLAQRNAVSESLEVVFSQIDVYEGLQTMDVVEKLKWLVNEVTSLQGMLSEKNAIFENFEEILSHNNVPKEETDLIEKLRWHVNLTSSLEETLSQRNKVIDYLEESFSQISVPVELQSVDTVEKLKWLVEERNALKDNLLEFHKLKDALSLIDLPETASSSDLKTRIGWLKESVNQSKGEINELREELARTKTSAQNEIDQLSALLSAELQEKEYIKMELDVLERNFEEVHLASSEKHQMVQMLLERSGITADSLEPYQTYSDLPMLIDRCFGKIKEESNSSSDTSAVAEVFESMQSLLYVRDQELMLCEKLLEEDMLVRSEVINLSGELKVASLGLSALKEEKDTLQKDLERTEEKSAFLREKLSLAVKKGKGLVQDRENLKLLVEEKKSEVENLKLGLQKQESIVSDCRDEINRLSADLEQIPKLETDLVAAKDQHNQLEQFLLESNNMLQRVIESIDGIVLPVASDFDEPAQKVNWLAGYLIECQQAKIHMEQDLEKVKEETNILASELADAQRAMKSLEDALSAAENQISQLSEEKGEMEVAKRTVELDLQKAIDETTTQTSKFTEACATIKSLEDSLSLAENNISMITKEREEVRLSRASTEAELEKLREDITIQTSKLTETFRTVKSLEDALSQAETNVSLLTEQNNRLQDDRSNLESELKKLKEEADFQTGKLTSTLSTIKSLEDALLKASNDIALLEDEKKTYQQKISMLNSKLNTCMDELAGTSGSLESRSVELMHLLGDLQIIMKNESLLSMVRQHFEKQFESLKNIDLILNDITVHFVDTDLEALKSYYVMEEDSCVTKPFPYDLGNRVNSGIVNGQVNAVDVDNIPLYFKETVEEFQLRNKNLAENFEGFSIFTNEFIEALLRKLRISRDAVSSVFENMGSLKAKMKNSELLKEEHEKTIAKLEQDRKILLSACTNATRELQFEVKNKLLELSSIPELEKLNCNPIQEASEAGAEDTEHQQRLDEREYAMIAEKLSLAATRAQTLAKLFESTSNVAAATIEDLQNKLVESTATSEKATEKCVVLQNRVLEFETDVEALQNSSQELGLKIKDYQAMEEKLKEQEAELSALQEAEEPLMSVSQLKTLFEKISRIEIPFEDSEVGGLEPQSSVDVKKLFYIVDSISELHNQLNTLSHDKEELQSTLSTRILEIENLKEETETQFRNRQDYEKIKNEMSELFFGLEKLIVIFGDHGFVGEQNSSGEQRLLPALEKQIMALLLEVDNAKSYAEELDTKLLGSQKVIDELSSKIKVLEDSLQSRTAKPEIVQERSIFEAPPPTVSEISEIEDAGPVGKNGIAPVASSTASAAHVRTMRKGSTDHLALNVDLESGSLINHEETDEDKGHVFKSLNTSGLIPKQGKSAADRIDSIWVSGGRVLMSRPRARLGLIAYWLFLHIWLLGTIL